MIVHQDLNLYSHDVEYLFMCLFAIMSIPFSSISRFAHFLIALVVFCCYILRGFM